MNRVDIDKLAPSDTNDVDITGGYIFKIDRRDPEDSGFTAGGQGSLTVPDRHNTRQTPQIDRPSPRTQGVRRLPGDEMGRSAPRESGISNQSLAQRGADLLPVDS